MGICHAMHANAGCARSEDGQPLGGQPGERPVVRAKAGKLEYDLQRIIEGKPVDNIYDALKQLPGVVEMNGGLTLGARGVTIVLDGKVTNMSTEQLYALLRSMPADRVERVDVMFNAPARYQVRGAMIDVRLRHRIGDPGTVQGERPRHGAGRSLRQVRPEPRGQLPGARLLLI